MAKRIFTCVNFEGHWPVPTAAVVMAEDHNAARDALAEELRARGLGRDDPRAWVLVEWTATEDRVLVLSDGNY